MLDVSSRMQLEGYMRTFQAPQQEVPVLLSMDESSPQTQTQARSSETALDVCELMVDRTLGGLGPAWASLRTKQRLSARAGQT